jgi:hypothetical protein
MRPMLVVLGIIVGTGAISTGAEAQNYPWCAYYGGQMGGSSNCGFVSFQQCMATLSGMGGFCDRNTQYVPAGPNVAHRQPRHRHPAS